MKRLILYSLALMAIVGCSKQAEVRVATFNIRYDSAADAKSGDSWDGRKASVAEVIVSHDFDIVGTQEGDNRQITDLLSLMPDYDCTGHSYGGSSGDLHTATIFYKSSKLELLDAGTFWYSPTPEVESKGWDATICVCAIGVSSAIRFRARSLSSSIRTSIGVCTRLVPIRAGCISKWCRRLQVSCLWSAWAILTQWRILRR